MGASCSGPETPLPKSVPGTGLRAARWPEGNFTKESEPRANLPGRDKVERLALSSCPPRRQRELSARGGSRTFEEAEASREMEAQGHLWWAAPRAHTQDSRGERRTAFALRTFPQAPSGARPSALRSRPRQRPNHQGNN